MLLFCFSKSISVVDGKGLINDDTQKAAWQRDQALTLEKLEFETGLYFFCSCVTVNK